MQPVVTQLPLQSTKWATTDNSSQQTSFSTKKIKRYIYVDNNRQNRRTYFKKKKNTEKI